MSIAQFGATALIAALLTVGAANAQTSQSQTGPAERPPEGYSANQYVDSAGCVFTRARLNGATQWVPRVTADRQVVCGLEPTFATSEPAPVVAAVPVSSPSSVVAVSPSRPAAGSGAGHTRNVSRAQTVQLVRAPSNPTVIVLEQATQADLTRRIIPEHVYMNRLGTLGFRVPPGYKPAWEDGRLNPRRAEQNLAGHIASKLIWTDTVPRRLVDARSGRDLTNAFPLVYPYTDVVTQRREFGEVTLLRENGRTYKQVVRNAPGSESAPIYSTRSSGTVQQRVFEGR